MKKYLAFFQYQLMLFWQNAEFVVQGILFFFLVSLTVGILFPNLDLTSVLQVYFLVTVFTLFLMTDNIWKVPFKQGMFDVFYFYPLSMTQIVGIYYLIGLCSIVLPLIFINIIALVILFSGKLAVVIYYTFILTTVLIGLLLLIFFMQAVILMIDKKAEFLGILLSLPLAMPWIIVAIRLITETGGTWFMLLGLYCVYLPCLLYGTAWSLRQIHT